MDRLLTESLRLAKSIDEKFELFGDLALVQVNKVETARRKFHAVFASEELGADYSPNFLRPVKSTTVMPPYSRRTRPASSRSLSE